ncbi:homeobox protein msx-1-like protein [Plakobranchus ocellatus]|uniref:Homeobox protein msx-1-like protein n=1 Tax=Plakobranchus ocellatus TaxID=259542 RepID=A0AAV4C3W2_9GAST|nr:homeobox protein msx-1-like protein [Plakobranchus ocellatus]
MTPTKESSSVVWEPLLTRVKQEESFSDSCLSFNCSGSLTSSPPLSSPRMERSPIEQDNAPQTSGCLSEPEGDHRAGLRRPELTFSIERILGLNSCSQTIKSPPMVVASVPERRVFSMVVAGNTVTAGDRRSCHRGRNRDDNDDEDIDDDDMDEEDDEDDDNESVIDVGGPGENTHFLSRPGHEFSSELTCANQDGVPNYQWLHCTRYHPPKLQRSKKASGGKKRKLGRNPRVPFTQHQAMVLEEKFRRTHYLSSMDVAELSTALSITETRIFPRVLLHENIHLCKPGSHPSVTTSIRSLCHDRFHMMVTVVNILRQN